MLTIERTHHSLDIKSGKPVIIPGPCSVDSEDLALYTINEAKRRNIDTIRLDLFKPRTSPFNADGSPAYVGAEEAGLPWLRMAIAEGITPATEVMMLDEAEMVIDAVSGMPNRSLVLWVGARNYNHKFVSRLGAMVQDEDWIRLGIKSPTSHEEAAWGGMVKWARDVGGVPPERLMMIYRGLPVRKSPLRGDPFWEDAEAQRLEGIKMLLDPSHMSKERGVIFQLAQEGLGTGIFDGLMIEVHPWPNWHEPSKTDPGITFDMLDELDIPQPLTLVRQLNGLHTEQRVQVGA